MTEHSTTQCVLFPELFVRPVVAQFDQAQGSSDGGAALLKAADQRLGLATALAACLKDERQEKKVDHEYEELLTQRIMAIACGFADGNDAAQLSHADASDASNSKPSRLGVRCFPGNLEQSWGCFGLMLRYV